MSGAARREHRPLGAFGLRRVIPWTILPLTLAATLLASSFWLRAFPANVMAGPLFGAAVISVLLPVAVISLFSRRLWISALLDVAALGLYLLFVVLKDPIGFHELWQGLSRGPSQLLTFALPLVSPPSLLVAPIVVCWVSGAIAGECIGRDWQSVLPYLAWLATFALTYAGTARAIESSSDGRRQDTLVGAALLLVLLLIRAAQAWLSQDDSSDATQANAMLPTRGFVLGAIIAVVLAAGAAVVVQAPALSGPPTTPQRSPGLRGGTQLTPLSFIAGLRTAPKAPVFRVSVDRQAPGYFAIASVDQYDGEGWTFQRTFRPSGGVLPGETDPALRLGSAARVRQRYEMTGDTLRNTPWMPALSRVQRVSGVVVDIDAMSGMVVPANGLSGEATYTVYSDAPRTAFLGLGDDASPATSPPPSQREVPTPLRSELSEVVQSLVRETGVPSAPALPFLRAVSEDLKANYALSAATKRPRSTNPAPSDRAAPGERTGSTGFRDVLESILGPSRAGTPEQYATLLALLARQLDVPARVVTGFRVDQQGGGTLASGTYAVSTDDAWTWVEIPVQDAGWVILDAAPVKDSALEPTTSVGTEPPTSPSRTTAPNVAVTTETDGGNAPAPPSAIPASQDITTVMVLVLILVGVGVLAITLVAVLLLRKRWRVRRRRRVADPRRRLVGAWHETIDVLIEGGLTGVETMTSSEISQRAAARFGARAAQHATTLGETANAAIFSPSTPVTPADAEAAWSQHWLLRNEMYRALGIRARIGAATRYHRAEQQDPIVAPTSWSDVVRPRRRRRRRVPGRHRSAAPTKRH